MDSLFPSPPWTLPLTSRLSSSSPLDILVHSLQASARVADASNIINILKRNITPHIHYLRHIFFLSFVNSNGEPTSQTVDLKFRTTYDTSVRTRTSGIINIDLPGAFLVVSGLERGRGDLQTRFVVSTLDLRRLVLDSPEDVGHVKDVTGAMLDEEERWSGCEEVLADILVASEEVKKLVDEVVREWEKEERRSQCRVVWSA